MAQSKTKTGHYTADNVGSFPAFMACLGSHEPNALFVARRSVCSDLECAVGYTLERRTCTERKAYIEKDNTKSLAGRCYR
jgi:hypothetical protein